MSRNVIHRKISYSVEEPDSTDSIRVSEEISTGCGGLDREVLVYLAVQHIMHVAHHKTRQNRVLLRLQYCAALLLYAVRGHLFCKIQLASTLTFTSAHTIAVSARIVHLVEHIFFHLANRLSITSMALGNAS